MSYCTDKLMIDGQTHAHTHAGNDNTRRPKLASGKNRTYIVDDILYYTKICKKNNYANEQKWYSKLYKL